MIVVVDVDDDENEVSFWWKTEVDIVSLCWYILVPELKIDVIEDLKAAVREEDEVKQSSVWFTSPLH